MRYGRAGGRASTPQAEETIDGSHLGRRQPHPSGRLGESTEVEHQDQRLNLRPAAQLGVGLAVWILFEPERVAFDHFGHRHQEAGRARL